MSVLNCVLIDIYKKGVIVIMNKKQEKQLLGNIRNVENKINRYKRKLEKYYRKEKTVDCIAAAFSYSWILYFVFFFIALSWVMIESGVLNPGTIYDPTKMLLITSGVLLVLILIFHFIFRRLVRNLEKLVKRYERKREKIRDDINFEKKYLLKYKYELKNPNKPFMDIHNKRAMFKYTNTNSMDYAL